MFGIGSQAVSAGPASAAPAAAASAAPDSGGQRDRSGSSSANAATAAKTGGTRSRAGSTASTSSAPNVAQGGRLGQVGVRDACSLFCGENNICTCSLYCCANPTETSQPEMFGRRAGCPEAHVLLRILRCVVSPEVVAEANACRRQSDVVPRRACCNSRRMPVL